MQSLQSITSLVHKLGEGFTFCNQNRGHLAAVATGTLALMYVAKFFFNDSNERNFGMMYKVIPDCVKNYVSFKRAKIITLAGTTSIGGCALFFSSALVQCIALPILGLAIALGLYRQREKPVSSYKYSDQLPVDEKTVLKWGNALKSQNFDEILKLDDQLSRHDHHFCYHYHYYDMRSNYDTMFYYEDFSSYADDSLSIILKDGYFDFTIREIELQKSLFRAVLDGYIDVVKWFISSKAIDKLDLNAIDSYGYGGLTLLHLAAAKNHQEIVTLLIENGASQDIECQGQIRTIIGYFKKNSTFSDMGIINTVLNHMKERNEFPKRNLSKKDLLDYLIRYSDVELLNAILDSTLVFYTNTKLMNKFFDRGIVSYVQSLVDRGTALKNPEIPFTMKDLFIRKVLFGQTELAIYIAKKEKISLDYQCTFNKNTALHALFSCLFDHKKQLYFTQPVYVLKKDMLLLISEGADPTILNGRETCFDRLRYSLNRFYEKEGVELVIDDLKLKCFNHYFERFKALKDVVDQEACGVMDLIPKFMNLNLANPQKLFPEEAKINKTASSAMFST